MSRGTLRSLMSAMAVVSLAWACAETPTSGPEVGEIQLKPGNGNGGGGNGGGGNGGSDGPEVKGVEPDSGYRGTTLDVEISGSGFDDGSSVVFELTVDDVDTLITVNSTQFVSSRKLRSNITIDDSADVGLRDVVVITARGPRGRGTESFRVEKPPIPLTATFEDASGDGVVSDGQGPYQAYISGSASGGQFKLDAKLKSPRMLCSDYPDNASGTQWDSDPEKAGCSNGYFSGGTGIFQNIVVGDTAWTTMLVHMEGWFLQYGYACPAEGWPPEEFPADYIIVTHPDHDTWVLEGSDAILCVQQTKKGNPPPSEVGRFPMRFRIVAVREP